MLLDLEEAISVTMKLAKTPFSDMCGISRGTEPIHCSTLVNEVSVRRRNYDTIRRDTSNKLHQRVRIKDMLDYVCTDYKIGLRKFNFIK